MKKIFIATALIIASVTAFAQTQYEISRDKNGSKVLKGLISRDLLETDTAFQWYFPNKNAYSPNADAVSAIKKNSDSIQFVVFMGTWCEDSHSVVPKFFGLLDAAGFSKDRVTLIGVDRNKRTLSHLAEALNVVNVPTIITMKNGVEIGRVVEYGKSGMFDKDLAEIINAH